MSNNALSPFQRLPVDMYLVRNGMNEGSVALSKFYTGSWKELDSFKHIHSSRWRLTNYGKMQAKFAGDWITKNHKGHFNAYLSSEYVRSLETAAHLGLKDAMWTTSLYLRPREFGDFSVNNRSNSTSKLNINEYQRQLGLREKGAFYWTPPNGESIAHLSLRTERVINWIRNHVDEDGSVIIVSNKDTIESMRIRMENISQSSYKKIIMHPPPLRAINFGTIYHYTRRNPKNDIIDSKYKWMRVATPWMGSKFAGCSFDEIENKEFTNENLLEMVSNVPRNI